MHKHIGTSVRDPCISNRDDCLAVQFIVNVNIKMFECVRGLLASRVLNEPERSDNWLIEA